MNLEICGTKWSWPIVGTVPAGDCLEEMRKAMKASHDNRCPDRDSNWAHPEYNERFRYTDQLGKNEWSLACPPSVFTVWCLIMDGTDVRFDFFRKRAVCGDGFTLPYVRPSSSQREHAVGMFARERKRQRTGGGRDFGDTKRDPCFYKYSIALVTLTMRVSHARNMSLCMLMSPYRVNQNNLLCLRIYVSLYRGASVYSS
jgi:hypothetical protein